MKHQVEAQVEGKSRFHSTVWNDLKKYFVELIYNLIYDYLCTQHYAPEFFKVGR